MSKRVETRLFSARKGHIELKETLKELKELLFPNGYGYIWNNQGTRGINAIINFERRMKDIVYSKLDRDYNK